ncbi:MAG: hypothetical protein U5K79_14920 [Cyclobacteriaceae bacterium]|nr:hypothetical protein [Cyclobacteriaceae bacterium]
MTSYPRIPERKCIISTGKGNPVVVFSVNGCINRQIDLFHIDERGASDGFLTHLNILIRADVSCDSSEGGCPESAWPASS